MNPAINAALIAAAANKQTSQQALVKQLTAAKAFGPTSAIPLSVEGSDQEKALAELVGTMTVRPWNGGYYLDRDRKKAREQQQGWIALIVLLAVGSVLASAVALLTL